MLGPESLARPDMAIVLILDGSRACRLESPGKVTVILPFLVQQRDANKVPSPKDSLVPMQRDS